MGNAYIPHQTPPAAPVADLVVNPDNFYPSFSISAYRRDYRNDDTITDARLSENLKTAMIFINAQLTTWRAETRLRTLNGKQQQLYNRAVFHRCKIYCVEQYLDIDTSAEGERKAAHMEARRRMEQQREREAVRLLTGKPRTTARLV